MVRQPPVRTRTSEDKMTDTKPPQPDISATVETQLKQLEGQLDQLRTQVRQAQQLAGLGTAAAMIAHEFSNLLTPIKSYAQKALEDDDRELQRKALTVTLQNVDILVRMADRVLEIGAAKPAQRELVEIRAVVEDAAACMCRDVGKDGIRFSVAVDDAATAWVDRLQLQQIFFNLFINAHKAMAPSHGGRLTVTGTRDGDRVVVDIKDTGPGISPELLPHVFDPLQTSRPLSSNGRQRCAGLGLTLCRDLVEENGGKISVTSKQGVGTTFTIELPTTGSVSE